MYITDEKELQVFNVPGNMLLTVISPNRAIAMGATIWGIASTAQAGAQSFPGMVVARLFIGLGRSREIRYDLTCTQVKARSEPQSHCTTASGSFIVRTQLTIARYTRDEIASRLSLYIGSGSLAGALVLESRST